MMVEQCNSCDYNLFKLKADLEDDKKQLITFCIKHKLVLEQLQCRTCNKDCTLNYKKAVFRCQKTIYVTKNKQKKKKSCCFEQSIWNNTFFSKSNLPTLTILHFIRSFLYGFKVEVTKHLLDISLQTISNWRSICREVCLHYQSQQLKILGQIGGKNMIVEIDKTCLGKQKHNVGTIDTYKDIWVFGGIERQSKRIFLELIEDKSAATLTNIIQKYIAPETTIFSDGWASNCKLSKLGFTHCVVNRKHKFVNAETGVHTQSIENLWKNLKRFRFDGSRNSMFPGYIATFFFKRNFPDEGERFHQFLLEAASLYNPSIPNPYRRRIKNSKCKDSNQLPPETSNLGTSSNFTAQSTPWEFIDVLKKEPGLQKDDGNKEITVKEEIPIKEEIEVEEETLFPPETTKDSFLTFEFENCSDFDNKPYAILPAIETDGRDSELVNGHKAINLNHIKEENRTNDSSFCSENTTYNRININEGTIKVSRKDKELPDRLNSDNLDEEDELIIPEMQLHHRVSPRLPWPEEEESSGAEIDEDPLSIELEDLEERNSLYHKAPSRTRSREQESTAHSFETHKKRTKIDN